MQLLRVLEIIRAILYAIEHVRTKTFPCVFWQYLVFITTHPRNIYLIHDTLNSSRRARKRV